MDYQPHMESCQPDLERAKFNRFLLMLDDPETGLKLKDGNEIVIVRLQCAFDIMSYNSTFCVISMLVSILSFACMLTFFVTLRQCDFGHGGVRDIRYCFLTG